MARKRPTPEDAATARRILLDGLARDARLSELLGELEPLHPRNDTFPGEVFLYLAADALESCRASRTCLSRGWPGTRAALTPRERWCWRARRSATRIR
jgi:hypothetical protein